MKLDKKILIDLFKSRTAIINPVDFKGSSFYYSDLNLGFEKGCGIEFNVLNEEIESLTPFERETKEKAIYSDYNSRRKNGNSRNGDVFLAIGEFNNKFFIAFNTLKIEITKEDYDDLMSWSEKKDKESDLNHNMMLLKSALNLEAKKQIRKTLVEKKYD